MSQLNLQPAVFPENTTGILSTCWMLRLHTSNAGGQTAAGDESRAANADDAVPEDAAPEAAVPEAAVPAAAVPAAAVPAAAVPAAMNARARPVDGTAPAASPVLATIARATAASTADRRHSPVGYSSTPSRTHKTRGLNNIASRHDQSRLPARPKGWAFVIVVKRCCSCNTS